MCSWLRLDVYGTLWMRYASSTNNRSLAQGSGVQDDSLSKEIKHLKFLVLDEADRMIETGHFVELENILRLTLRESRHDHLRFLNF